MFELSLGGAPPTLHESFKPFIPFTYYEGCISNFKVNNKIKDFKLSIASKSMLAVENCFCEFQIEPQFGCVRTTSPIIKIKEATITTTKTSIAFETKLSAFTSAIKKLAKTTPITLFAINITVKTPPNEKEFNRTYVNFDKNFEYWNWKSILLMVFLGILLGKLFLKK